MTPNTETTHGYAYPNLLSQIFNRAHMMTPELMAMAVDFSRSHLGLAATATTAPGMAMYDYDLDDDEDGEGENDDDQDEDRNSFGLSVIPIAGPLVPRTGIRADSLNVEMILLCSTGLVV